MDISVKTLCQFCKYSIAGGIGAGIDFITYTLLITFLSLNYLFANATSFSLGTIVVYYLQKKWTFQHKSKENTYLFTKFISVVVVTYIFNNVILIVCVNFLLLDLIIAKVIQIILSFMWGYTVNKHFVFK